MKEIIKVGMADLKTCQSPDVLTTLGLGSCVGIVLFDSLKKIAGLAHVMLPDSKQIRNNTNKAKFADTAIDVLIEEMKKLGASEERLTAKLAGGAQMFAFASGSDLMRIGERNAEASRRILKAKGIKIISEDTGANYGRTIEFYSDTGKLLIKTIGKEPKII